MDRLFADQAANCALTFTVIVAFCVSTRAAEPQGMHREAVPSNSALMDDSAGGVLSESYQHHRIGYANGRPAHPTIAPEAGWYGYGFPVQTHRWGWFGAERYYPRVVWHRGYYGDCCRWAYRDGY